MWRGDNVRIILVKKREKKVEEKLQKCTVVCILNPIQCDTIRWDQFLRICRLEYSFNEASKD